jgi:Planctomycete cytochrome C
MAEDRASVRNAGGVRRAVLLAALLGLSACQNAVGDGVSPSGAAAPGGHEEPGEPGAISGALPRVLPCGQATEKARAVLENHCGGCHDSESSGKGGFDTVDDPLALIASGKIVPGEPDASPLYKKVADGLMPPKEVAERPAAAELKSLREWITCGATDWSSEGATSLPFVDIDTRLHAVLADLRAMPNPVDRERMRYVDLSTLANAGYSNDQLELYRESVFFLLNSLSRGREVIAPRAIDQARLLFRIDMRDYLWTAQTWRLMEQRYPYAVIYANNSRLFPIDEVSAEQIRQQTGSSIPIMQADWLLSHASRPPLYHQMLELPRTLAQVESALGVDVGADVSGEQVLRAGFANAATSKNHGVIERHALEGGRGALWVAYDFASTLGQRNVFVNPFDFRPDGQRLIFNLDNGLLAFMVLDAAGNRIDKAPNSLVQDPLARDGAIENGSSCLGCHQAQGVLEKYDEVRDFLLKSGPSAQVIEAALGLYADRASLSEAFAADRELYLKARARLGVKQLEERTIRALDNTHLGLMDIAAAAGVLGIDPEQLARALDASTASFPPEILALRVLGGAIQRDAFDAVVGDVVEVLGLGRPLRADAQGNLPRPVADAGLVDPPAQDAGAEDAGPSDAGRSDAGALDAGVPDAAASDAGAPDASARDAAASDAGSDAQAARTDGGSRYRP